MEMRSTNTFSDTLLAMSPLEKVVGFLLLTTAIVSGTLLASSARDKTLIDMPRNGGIYTEGIVGTPRFANPLLAVSGPDRDLTAVVYAGLMKRNATNELVPELAQEYSVSTDGTVYTFTLKDGLTFHDGTPLTADDVVYTIKQAANPAVRSPLYANWEGVKVEAKDARTVSFTLPEPYAPFIENTIAPVSHYKMENATNVPRAT